MLMEEYVYKTVLPAVMVKIPQEPVKQHAHKQFLPSEIQFSTCVFQHALMDGLPEMIPGNAS